MKSVLLLVYIALVTGCVSRAVQTEEYLAAPKVKSSAYVIKDVPFVDQSVGYCGPATLTMAMKWIGKDVSIDEIAKQTYTPGFKGSLQSDLITTSRRHGLMAVSIKNLNALLTEIEAGNPVIVFENLSVSWLPTWHYALILGYDLNKEEIIMHSGHDAYRRWDMKKFERSWMLGEYWGLVVLPAGELAASADELANVAAAVGLEQSQKTFEADLSYQAILKKWPQSLVALVGLANLKYKMGNKKEAISLLQQATKFHPDSEAAKHNLMIAQGKNPAK